MWTSAFIFINQIYLFGGRSRIEWPVSAQPGTMENTPKPQFGGLGMFIAQMHPRTARGICEHYNFKKGNIKNERTIYY